MTLTVVTPEKEFLKQIAVKQVLVPGKEGQLGILPGHAPLICVLGKGALKYQLLNNLFQVINVEGGYFEVQTDEAVVLAEKADKVIL